MSYQVLARKYRPTSFEELRGQEHVVQALANALTQQRLHHAYLFTGTRGVGKTTVSRILAKSLNCTGADGQGGITATPCGQCPACLDIDAGRFVDYVELDAASNRGVEEISQLLDQAVYKPVVGRFKVYMIDEVHMLSNTAFNAMLKTLEEPPEYLKFVLATTDPQKVPVTVLSRCLQFNLRPMAPQTVLEHLTAVLQTEQVAAEPGALRLLARAARGSMRDALSLTDQAIAFGAGALQEAQVRQMLGSVDRSHVVGILDALVAGSGPDVVAQADGLRSLGLSAAGTLEDMATLLQQIAVAQAAPAALDEQDPDTAESRRFAPLLPADELQLLYSMALHGRQELGLAPDEYAGLTMVLLRMLAFRPQGGQAQQSDAPKAAPPVRAQFSPSASTSALAHAASGPSSPAAPASAAPSAPLLRPTVAVAAVPAPVSSPAPSRATAPSTAAASLASLAPARASEESSGGSSPAQALHAEPAVPAVPAARRTDPDSPSARLKPRPVTVEARADRQEPSSDDLPPWLDAPPADEEGDNQTRAADVAVAEPYSSTAGQAVVLQATPEGESWYRLVKSLPLTALVRELALQAQCLSADAPHWRLRVERESLRQPALKDKLQAALSEALGAPQSIEIEAGTASDSPALRDAAAVQARQRETEQIVLQDPLVQQLLAQYKTARIVPGSIKPH